MSGEAQARIRILERRLTHLERRLEDRHGDYSGSVYDVAEADALRWALTCLRERESVSPLAG